MSSSRYYINDSIVHFVTFEAINYIINKDIEQKQKTIEIEELGQHLGERISNHLLNQGNSITKMEADEVMKFLGRDVWTYLFGKQISKLQTNRKGTFLLDCEEIRFHSNLIVSKNPNPETTTKIDLILQFICGIIKGVIYAFNMECNVSAVCRQNVIYNNLLSFTSDNINNNDGTNAGSSGTTYPYSFTINLIAFNN